MKIASNVVNNILGKPKKDKYSKNQETVFETNVGYRYVDESRKAIIGAGGEILKEKHHRDLYNHPVIRFRIRGNSDLIFNALYKVMG